MKRAETDIRILPPGERPVAELAAIWRASVRATHGFLTAGDIEALLPEVQEAIAGVERLAVALGPGGAPVGFIGVEREKIEMLFLAPESRGGGLGRALVEFARAQWQVRLVDVNEQNTGGVGFYERMGFAPLSRDETDDAGRPFPILHLGL